MWKPKGFFFFSHFRKPRPAGGGGALARCRRASGLAGARKKEKGHHITQRQTTTLQCSVSERVSCIRFLLFPPPPGMCWWAGGNTCAPVSMQWPSLLYTALGYNTAARRACAFSRGSCGTRAYRTAGRGWASRGFSLSFFFLLSSFVLLSSRSGRTKREQATEAGASCPALMM